MAKVDSLYIFRNSYKKKTDLRRSRRYLLLDVFLAGLLQLMTNGKKNTTLTNINLSLILKEKKRK